MSKWDKLVQDILDQQREFRFQELKKALEMIGYHCEQPRGGSSHYTFRKFGCPPITLPKHVPMNRAYVKLVSEAIEKYLIAEE